MSGRLKSTGKLTNHGKNSLDISNISNLKILGLDIYSIPLSTSLFSDVMRGIGKVLQPFFHPVISPTFCHIALKLNLENLDDIVIIEYGQYLTEESLRYFDRAISNLGSSDYRSENNKAKYFLSHDTERERIAFQGYEKVRNGFSYEKRISEMFEIAGITR